MKRSTVVLAAGLLTAALVVVRMFWSPLPPPSAPEPAAASKPAVARETDMPLAPAPAGVEAAAVRVHGEVTSTHGDRLPDVRVSATAGRAAEAVTDAGGAYELRLEPIGGEV